VNQVVRAGFARYSSKERLVSKRIWVVPRRELFVPDVDEGFFILLIKEARMNIKRNFWKQGPLLAGLLIDSLNRK